MMKKLNYYLLIIIMTLVSYKPQGYLEFRHKNSLKIYNDEVRIKISPTKDKDSASIKINYYNTITEKLKPKVIKIISNKKVTKKTKISRADYNAIITLFGLINEEELKFPKYGTKYGLSYVDFGYPDCGSNSIYFKNRDSVKIIQARGLDGNFYLLAEKIAYAADISIEQLK